MPEFLIAKGKQQLIPKLQELLARSSDNDSVDSLRRACRLFIEPFDEPYGERLLEFIEAVAHNELSGK